MKEQPLITVILPVRNSASNLEECISSIFAQSYKNIEVIATDDFSLDKSYSILRKLKKQDKRLRIYRNVKNYGVVVSLNRMVKKAKGEFITFMDTGDFLSPNKLKKQVNFLLNNPGVVAVGSQVTFIDDAGKKIGRSDFPAENYQIYRNPLQGISMQFESVLINKKALPKDVLKFNLGSNTFIYSDILIKIANYGKLANLDQFLHYHRNNPKIYLSDVKRNIISLFKLWIKSRELYDYQTSFRAFFSPLIKSV